MSQIEQVQTLVRLRAGTIGVVVATTLITLGSLFSATASPLRGAFILAAGAACAVLFYFRWRSPGEVFVVLLLLGLLTFLVLETTALALWIWAVAAFLASCWVRAGRSQWIYVSASVVLPSGAAAIGGSTMIQSLELLVPMIAASAIGFALRNRALLATTVAEREALERASAALATQNLLFEERTRIARDLHDSMAQSLAIISAQADGASRIVSTDPSAAVQALEVISRTSKQAQGQVRETVFALRDSAPVVGANLAETIDELAARVSYSGVLVETHYRGELTRIPQPVTECVALVAREALTNVLKYAQSGVPAQLALEANGEMTQLSVVNQIADSVTGAGEPGHGIMTMRERVGLLGGTIDVTRDSGVFTLVAHISSGVAR